MSREPTRRRFLGSVAALPAVAGGLSAVGDVRARRSVAASRFDPAVDGLGFRNWSTADLTFPEHDHTQVSETEIRRTIKRDWKDPLESLFDVSVNGLPSALINTIAEQLYVTANQLSSTNGHCYGMVFTAQQYFEQPETVPFDVDAPSEVAHPETPTDDPDYGPVADEIDLYQTSQALNLHAWFGRRNLLVPQWIDYERQLENLTAVVDDRGTAGITVFDPATKLAHQVLVYGYETETDGVRLYVYDPNFAAQFYERWANRQAASIYVDTSGDRPSVEPYKTGFRGPGYESFDGFSEFVYNRLDRVIRSQSDPSPHLAAGVSARDLRERLLALTLFKTDTSDVSLAVVAPDGTPVTRIRSQAMDRRRTAYHETRYRYGAPAGDYRVVVTGERDTEYTLETKAADTDGELLASAVTTAIEAGQTHTYTVTVPESPGGDSAVERGVDGLPDWLKLAAAAVAGGVAGAGLTRLRDRRAD
ncbi:hypothetical protein SAMN04487949_2014 [Halogranum gelatinilyticum]|uniref:Uncharacterized protein n=1 Tax=Halogranum gelatinilyticum TaxID=660521 RepID=A0A1G9U3T0_9EURY|nr:hypothetical protein [Halogranum gelatinilyticum]SDM54205.1 hypothetical protein SAMN04487949_2014 [Halogranum gelatinilyticum]